MGWECAIRLWEQFPGLDEIWAVGRRKERLVKLEEKVNIPVRKFVLDLSQEKEREILKAELERLKPQVKFLVNAAGFGKIGNVCDLSEKDQSGMVQVNCTALTAVTTMVLPFMSQNSRILQFASSAAFLPQPGFAVYAASKGLCVKLQPGIKQGIKGQKDICNCHCRDRCAQNFLILHRQQVKFHYTKNWLWQHRERLWQKQSGTALQEEKFLSMGFL